MRKETEQLKQPAQGYKASKRQSQNSTAKSLTPKPALFPGKKLDVVSRRTGATEIMEEEHPQSQKAEAPISCSMPVSLLPHGFLLTIWCFSRHRRPILFWLPTGPL